jgi:hypothetical protein
VPTKHSSDQHSKASGRDRQKEKKATQSQEKRAQTDEKGGLSNAKEEERQQVEVTRRVAGAAAPYAEPPSGNVPGSHW